MINLMSSNCLTNCSPSSWSGAFLLMRFHLHLLAQSSVEDSTSMGGRVILPANMSSRSACTDP